MKTNSLKHSFLVSRPKWRIKINIRLNDECRNGHEDFSITAYGEELDGRGRWQDTFGGCCHDEILKHRPDLAPFIALHLSNCDGVPMYGAENGFYWFQGAFPDTVTDLRPCHGSTGSSGKSPDECRRILLDHLRANEKELAAICEFAPRSKMEFAYILEKLGFRAKWKAEAREAIRQLEEWTGMEFESKATRETWEPLKPEQVAEIEHKQASGYYSPEQVAERDAIAKAECKQKELAEIEEEHKAKLLKLEQNKQIKVFLVESFGTRHGHNVIWYSHTNEICANWTTTDKLWTREAWEEFTRSAEMSKLPHGLKFKFQERPKY